MASPPPPASAPRRTDATTPAPRVALRRAPVVGPVLALALGCSLTGTALEPDRAETGDDGLSTLSSPGASEARSRSPNDASTEDGTGAPEPPAAGSGGQGEAPPVLDLDPGGQAPDAAAPPSVDASAPPQSTGDAGAPDDPMGCGVEASCQGWVAALRHRYAFSGSGSVAYDSQGAAHGALVDVALSESGAVELSGEGQYVDLPNGIVSALESATFEAWVTWQGTQPWQRIFDFGISDAGADQAGVGQSYLYLAARSDGANPRLQVAFTNAGYGQEISLRSTSALTAGAFSHVAVVIDASQPRISLYRDGVLDALANVAVDLSTLQDENNWLGRSQYAADSFFEGSLDELRIYDAALSESQVALSFQRGPDAFDR